jgi:lipopolysaccharide transport system ATP-binding protein
MFLRLLHRRTTKLPTVQHFTQIEAGSTWVESVLRRLLGDQAEPSSRLTRDEFLERPALQDAKRFVVIRDPRDSLISHYFGVLQRNDDVGLETREKLQAMDIDGGLLYLIERDLDSLVSFQRSWLTSGEVLVRYEDLSRDSIAEFERLLIERLELPVPRRDVRAAVESCKVEGLPTGEWRKHFTVSVAEAVTAKCGNLLVSAGYEPDSNWAEKLGVSPPAKRLYRTSVLVRHPDRSKAEFTLIHLTHAKAGSSWIYRILRELFPERIAPRGRKVAEATGGDLSRHVFEPHRIYAAMFMRADEFDAHPELSDALRFVVIRDLRDTLVSLYFSVKVSHPLDAEGKRQRERETLVTLSTEDGLLHMIDTQLAGAAELQRSWLGRDELFYRYEDLLLRDYTLLRELLIERFRLPITEKALRAALGKYSFESQYGRKLGQEDASSHGRQGAPGNWHKHFTPRVVEAFAERFGQVLIDTGYERNLDWAKLR